MTDENIPGSDPAAIVRNEDSLASPPFQDKESIRTRVADLLKQADNETDRIRQGIANVFVQEDSLLAVTKSKDALEALVLRLREANQNLVIATVGAQNLQAKAESATHRQEEFLSMLAHELRNPLAPIAMAAELLGKITSAHPQLPKLQGIIARQVRHMTHLVNDLVDASLVSRGKITLEKAPLLLSEIIESGIETSQPFIDKRKQQLRIDLPGQPLVVFGDLVRLAQVFSNLLINSTKFTPEHGLLTVSAEVAGENVIVHVKDDGMGIAADFQPFVFDLFRQGPSSLDRSQGGLGIGLSLVRTIVQMHGGTVEVHSGGEGCGTEFTVSLPIAPESRSLADDLALKAIPVHRRRILLIDDNPDANEILKDLLELEGHAVISAFSGTDGLTIAREQVFDLVICDIGLPGMDGYEVLRQLRMHAAKPMPCFIALTGYHQLENRTRALEAGFDHYLVKPVAIEILLNLVSSCAVAAL